MLKLFKLHKYMLGTFAGICLANFAFACPVAVDVGHFNEKPGVISSHGIPEFDFNLALALKIRSALERGGCEVILIGAKGDLKELYQRTALAHKAKFFLSIHHDSVQEKFLQPWMFNGQDRLYNDQFAGFSLFVSHKNPYLEHSIRCASAIGSALRKKNFMPSLYHADSVLGESRIFADRENGVHYYENLVVLKTAKQPAVLFEAGVLINRDEELTLAKAETQLLIAEAVSSAIQLCLAK